MVVGIFGMNKRCKRYDLYTTTPSQYPNLGSTSSQRGESSSDRSRDHQRPALIRKSGGYLATKVLSILKDVATSEASSACGYDQLTEFDIRAFKHLVVTITNYSLRKIEKEWHSLKLILSTNQDIDLGPYHCELLL